MSLDDARDSDAFDVPAAVLCAFCGEAVCEGCLGEDDYDDTASGVIAIVPWERPGTGSGWSRLWATARASTQEAHVFFYSLPSGPVSPALRFAVIAEAMAVTSVAFMWGAAVTLAFPTLAIQVGLDAALRAEVGRWVIIAIPAVTLWMIAIHAIHGVSIERSARKQGARAQRGRAVRFGLYACGWDLMTSPLGALVTWVNQGFSETMRLISLAVRVPSKASLALLRGIYGLDEDAANRAHRSAKRIVSVAVVLSGTLAVSIFFWV